MKSKLDSEKGKLPPEIKTSWVSTGDAPEATPEALPENGLPLKASEAVNTAAPVKLPTVPP